MNTTMDSRFGTPIIRGLGALVLLVTYCCAYFPFGDGPRVCIGQHFAMLEATLAMAMVLREFELRTSPEPPAYDYRVTLQPATPLPCTLYPTAASVSSVTR